MRGRRVRVERVADVLEVVVVEQAAPLDRQAVEGLHDLRPGVLELRADDVPIGVLEDEREVEDADGPRVDEVAQRGRDLAVELVAREGNDQVFDRSDSHDQPSMAFCLSASYSGTVMAPDSLSWLSFSIWSAGVTPAAAFEAASCWVISRTSWAVTLGRLMM